MYSLREYQRRKHKKIIKNIASSNFIPASVTRASKHKRERTTNRTPEKNARKTQTTARVRRVKIPPRRSATMRREKVVRYAKCSARFPIGSLSPQQQVNRKRRYRFAALPGHGGNLDRCPPMSISDSIC